MAESYYSVRNFLLPCSATASRATPPTRRKLACLMCVEPPRFEWTARCWRSRSRRHQARGHGRIGRPEPFHHGSNKKDSNIMVQAATGRNSVFRRPTRTPPMSPPIMLPLPPITRPRSTKIGTACWMSHRDQGAEVNHSRILPPAEEELVRAVHEYVHPGRGREHPDSPQ